jgi:hypothetical protein
MTDKIHLVDIRIAAEKMAAAASAAYWATDDDRCKFLVEAARKALIAAGAAMGHSIDLSRIDALEGFIEYVRDFKPEALPGWARARYRQEEGDDLMLLAEFEAIQAYAETLFPATKKEKK